MGRPTDAGSEYDLAYAFARLGWTTRRTREEPTGIDEQLVPTRPGEFDYYCDAGESARQVICGVAPDRVTLNTALRDWLTWTVTAERDLVDWERIVD